MKVSILTITYNHERYITQAIESILVQKVNFDYEIVIGEDCSKDSTRGIVVDFQKRYPGKIRLLLREQNLGAIRNLVQTLHACQGEYVAILEGDDYWTSPHKLQKQVAFLDEHPECSMCFHDATIIHEDGSREPRRYCRVDQKEIPTLEDLLVINFIPTCSVMFRRGLVGNFPDWFYTLKMGDWPLHILNAQHGKIGYINEVMGVYRVHSGGIWTCGGKAWSLDDYIARTKYSDIDFYEAINRHLGYKYNNLIRNQISDRSYSLMKIYRRREDWKGMRKYLLKAFFLRPLNGRVSLKLLVQSLLVSSFPGAYRRYHRLKDWHKNLKPESET
jgi:glycosyltransferase involved in cell wall biosynthesis